MMEHLGENSLIHEAPAERISFIYVFLKKKEKKLHKNSGQNSDIIK